MTLELFVNILAITSFIIGGFVTFFTILTMAAYAMTPDYLKPRKLIIRTRFFIFLAMVIWPIAYFLLK
jgi:hypothetical protein